MTTHSLRRFPNRMQHGVHSPWFAFSGLFAFLFMTGAVRFSYGVMFQPMLEEFAWNRTAGSWAYSVNMFSFAITLPISGYLYDRFRLRRLLLLFGTVLVIGVLAMSSVQTVQQMILCYGVLGGIGFGGTSTTLLAAAVSRWFRARVGTLMAVGLAGMSLGQLCLLSLVSWTTDALGWRAAFHFLGLGTAAVLVAAVLVMRDRPQDARSEPRKAWTPQGREGKGPGVRDASQDVDAARGGNARSGARSTREVTESLSPEQAIQTASFWVMCGVYAICGFTDFLVDLHIVPMLLGRGASLVGGGTVKAVMGGAAFLGVMFSGWSSDRVGSRIPLSVSFAIRAAIFALVLFGESPFALQLFAVVYGFTFLASAPLVTVLVRELFGSKHIALLTGCVIFLHHSAGAFGSIAGSALFDSLGSYQLVLLAALILSGAATVLSFLIRKRPTTAPAFCGDAEEPA